MKLEILFLPLGVRPFFLLKFIHYFCSEELVPYSNFVSWFVLSGVGRAVENFYIRLLQTMNRKQEKNWFKLFSAYLLFSSEWWRHADSGTLYNLNT